MKKLTAAEMKKYKDMADNAKNIGEFKKIGRELRDTFSLKDMEAIDILNGRNELEILAKYEREYGVMDGWQDQGETRMAAGE